MQAALASLDHTLLTEQSVDSRRSWVRLHLRNSERIRDQMQGYRRGGGGGEVPNSGGWRYAKPHTLPTQPTSSIFLPEPSRAGDGHYEDRSRDGHWQHLASASRPDRRRPIDFNNSFIAAVAENSSIANG